MSDVAVPQLTVRAVVLSVILAVILIVTAYATRHRWGRP